MQINLSITGQNKKVLLLALSSNKAKNTFKPTPVSKFCQIHPNNLGIKLVLNPTHC